MYDGYIFKLDNEIPFTVAPREGVPSTKEPSFNVNVFTEFSPLKSVIIGYIDETAGTPFNDKYVMENDFQMEMGTPIPSDIIETGQSNLDGIAKALMDRGVNVIRPGKIDHRKIREVDGVKCDGFHCFNVRDLFFYYGNCIYETPNVWISRQFENEAYFWFFKNQIAQGAKRYTSFKGLIDTSKPFFDAANILRIGLDIVFLVSCSGMYEGYKALRAFMEKQYNGRVRVHPTYLYDGSHIDTTCTVFGYNKKIGKNIALINGIRNEKTKIPAIFRGKNWRLIEIRDEDILPDNGIRDWFIVASKWVAMNLFIVNPNLVLVSAKQTKIMKLLNFYGIETIPVEYTCGRHLAGGLHCISNDYEREEEKDYKKLLESNEKDLTKEDLACYFDPELLEFLKSKGDYEEWEKICNENNIWAQYLTDHHEK